MHKYTYMYNQLPLSLMTYLLQILIYMRTLHVDHLIITCKTLELS